ncbi:MAG: septal ring lytic transglycosylase RlpA family protein [Bacteroidia bacterium]|nr:septal ring lytic transglycosylase RlpA family protein [Bacteroidia bacterium]
MIRLYIFLFLIIPATFSFGSGTAPVKNYTASKIQRGVASYYHNKFNGRRTASGEIFWNDSLTAAHKTLPLGTWVRVTNLKNDSTVIVKVNDRLPKFSKRSIDLTTAAAKKLNFIRAGITKVKIEILEPKKLDLNAR